MAVPASPPPASLGLSAGSVAHAGDAEAMALLGVGATGAGSPPSAGDAEAMASVGASSCDVAADDASPLDYLEEMRSQLQRARSPRRSLSGDAAAMAAFGGGADSV